MPIYLYSCINERKGGIGNYFLSVFPHTLPSLCRRFCCGSQRLSTGQTWFEGGGVEKPYDSIKASTFKQGILVATNLRLTVCRFQETENINRNTPFVCTRSESRPLRKYEKIIKTLLFCRNDLGLWIGWLPSSKLILLFRFEGQR